MILKADTPFLAMLPKRACGFTLGIQFVDAVFTNGYQGAKFQTIYPDRLVDDEAFSCDLAAIVQNDHELEGATHLYGRHAIGVCLVRGLNNRAIPTEKHLYLVTVIIIEIDIHLIGNANAHVGKRGQLLKGNRINSRLRVVSANPLLTRCSILAILARFPGLTYIALWPLGPIWPLGTILAMTHILCIRDLAGIEDTIVIVVIASLNDNAAICAVGPGWFRPRFNHQPWGVSTTATNDQ